VSALVTAARVPAPRAAPLRAAPLRAAPLRDAPLRDAPLRDAPGARPLRLVPPVADPDHTALLDQIAGGASHAGWLVRRAAPVPAERALEFGVMRALLEAPLRHLPEPRRTALLKTAAGPAVTLLLGPARPDEHGNANIVMAHSFLWLAAALGADQGLALIVDDARWSDPASLEVLAYLARRVDDVPVLLVVAPGPGGRLPDSLRVAMQQRALAHRRREAQQALKTAEALITEGRFEEAYAMACRAGEESIGWRSTAAIALAHLGRREEAIALAETDLASARASGASGPVARALVARVVAEPDDAARAGLAERALEELADGPAQIEHSVRLRLEFGRSLTRLGHRVEAREPLRTALADADRAGATMLAQHARRELVATGLRPRRAALDGADALTPRQRQICALAAAGKGNRAIAAELFLSIKTVETHLAAAYRKLGVSTRASLAGRIDLPGASSLR
jgi:DNA-binding CsgD family transcriptional regulator